jgi:hypothetical protein
MASKATQPDKLRGGTADLSLLEDQSRPLTPIMKAGVIHKQAA